MCRSIPNVTSIPEVINTNTSLFVGDRTSVAGVSTATYPQCICSQLNVSTKGRNTLGFDLRVSTWSDQIGNNGLQ